MGPGSNSGSFFYSFFVFLDKMWIVTAEAIMKRIILTIVLSVAKIIVDSIVNHIMVMVRAFNLAGIPSLERYDLI